MSNENGIISLIRLSLKKNIKQYTMFIALIGLMIIFTILTGGTFIMPRNLSNLFIQTSYIAILACGVVLVIVAGHIDLSIGSVVGFLGAIAATLQVNLHYGTLVTIIITLFVGLLIGLWQGYWVAYRNVPAFIVTLAGMMIFKGTLLGVTNGATIAPLDDSFKALGQGYIPNIASLNIGSLSINMTTIIIGIIAIIIYNALELKKRGERKRYDFETLPKNLQMVKMIVVSLAIAIFFGIMASYKGIPYSIVFVLVVGILYTFITKNTTFGRHVYAIGGNKEASRLSGINIKQRNLLIFASMGILSALGAIIFTARLNAASASAGAGLELEVIASAIIGGTSTMGGEGTIVGAIIGALVMATLNNGMSLMNVGPTWQYIVKGLILLLAVWVDISTKKKN
ncbi:multiple monosaccharide ABC transporter permease [Vallitalea guaymasensis]|uniref:Xylose transport system permease protein XylH n=1 Tax=Vallitalea guaymasensis TaxID=1185412 RepID=A0A8J8SCD8_9FIRM|nr:multiple monosaccharide ABC transporter permease [Vallitalea guaymasensis]QUH29335.1 sugar ABC transporter permease [Vallitalea guaymasensis]